MRLFARPSVDDGFLKMGKFLPAILILSVCISVNLEPETVRAAGGYLAGYEEVEPKPSPVSWWSAFAYLVSLSAVFAVVVVTAYFAARFIGGRFNARMSASGGRVLENLPLGPNRSVCAVEMAGRVFLLGVTDKNITLLGEVNDREMIEHLHTQSLEYSDPFSKDFGTLSDLVKKIPPLFQKKD